MSQLITGALPTESVPDKAVEYAVLIPDNHPPGAEEPLPLLLYLHGGGGSREQLIAEHKAGLWDRRFETGILPPMVLAMISGQRSTYMDYFDGTQLWATFLQQEFLPFCEHKYRCGGQQSMRFATGTSMGGFGVLHLGFSHPDTWGAIAACEPAIDAAFEASNLTLRSFRRAFESAAQLDQNVDRHIGKFGPGESGLVADWDSAYFRAHNPVAMAHDRSEMIRASGMKILIEVGDQDNLMLHDAAELLHRVLWDQRIEHSFFLHHGADHVGVSMAWRSEAICQWLGRTCRDLHEPEELRAIRTAPPSEVEREWMALMQGLRTEPPPGPMPDFSGDRMIAIMRHGQEPAVRANYGGQTDGPAYLEGFKWRSLGDVEDKS